MLPRRIWAGGCGWLPSEATQRRPKGYYAGGIALICASARGCTEDVELLLRSGADVNTATTHGATAIHSISTRHRHCHKASALLADHGATIRPPSGTDRRPLDEEELYRLTDWLLERRATIAYLGIVQYSTALVRVHRQSNGLVRGLTLGPRRYPGDT